MQGTGFVKADSKSKASNSQSAVLGSSAGMKRATELAELAAPRRDPVLIYGETGTGKGLLAEHIHRGSSRTGAFVSVNCATFNPNLIESHLFGYVKGAFTGAEKDTPGLFETAQDGTLFLDEIAETPLEVQPRLLRALEEGLIRRVGGRSEIPVNVRLIAATHGDLPSRIAQGRFREDLYYRINAFIITLPPLRERIEDLPELAAHFLAALSEPGDPGRTLSAAALDALKRYSWPGNLRELRSALAFALAARPVRAGAAAAQLQIQREDLPDAVLKAAPPIASSPVLPAQNVPGEAQRLFTELYSRDPESPRAWARFLIAFQASLQSVRFGRHDLLPLLRGARGPSPTDSSLINEWQRRIKPLGLSLGLLQEANKKVQINLEACHAVLARTVNPDESSARPTAVISTSRRVPSNRLHRTNLPPPRTSFVGRQPELEELQRLLRDAPSLVTLTGPGGSGKTRLAQEAGWKLVDRLSGGVWFADLTEARNAEGVAYAVAAALRVPLTTHEPPESAVAGILRARGDCLLILDNFEQVAEAAQKTAGLWAKHAPSARILTTSRAVLGLEGERVKDVRPLSVPKRDEAKTLSRQAAEKFDAVKLFVERAEFANLSFELDEKNAPAIAEICAVLEGLPLAIELAAARISIMKPEQMVARLDQKFELLRSARRDLNERQRSLLATIDWSYQLLSEKEKSAFEKLSVFKGGFFLGAAEAVLELGEGKGPGVMDVIQGLRDKSLLHSFDTSTETRFSMYDAISEFAGQRLGEWADAAAREALQQRHAEHYTKYAEGWDRGIFRGQEMEAIERLALELDNLLSAQNQLMASLKEATGQRQAELRELLARCTLAMAHVMRVRGPAKERVPSLGRAIEAMGESDSEAKAKLMSVLSMAHSDRGEHGPSEKWAQSALEMGRRVGSKRVQALALMQQGWLLSQRGENVAACEPYELALPMFREIGEVRNEARILGRLGYLVARNGEIDRGAEMLKEATRMLEEQGDRFGLGFLLITRGNVEMRRGANREALPLIEKAEKHFRELGDKRSVGQCLGNRALALKFLRDYEGSLRCSDECQKIARELSDLPAIAIEQANRGHLMIDLDRLGEARASFSEAERLHRELKNNPLTGIDVENLAWLDAKEGKLESALIRYAEARELAKSDEVIVAGIDVSLGESLLEAGRAADALGPVRAALAVFDVRQIEDRDLFKALETLARCEEALRNREAAAAAALRALALAKELNYTASDPALRVRKNLEAMTQIARATTISK